MARPLIHSLIIHMAMCLLIGWNSYKRHICGLKTHTSTIST